MREKHCENCTFSFCCYFSEGTKVCRHLDRKTMLCKEYEFRPDICKNYYCSLEEQKAWEKKMDVIIKNVPEGAEDKIREMASVAIERFLTARDLKISEEIKKTFEESVDTFRKDNGLPYKFQAVEVDFIDIEPKQEPLEESL